MPSALLSSAVTVLLIVLALQVLDALLTAIAAGSVRDDDSEGPETLAGRPVRIVFWSLAVTAVLAVLVAFGVDLASRLVWEDQAPLAGAGVLVATALGAFVVGSLAAFALLRAGRPTYAAIRRDLRDRETLALDADQLAAFDDRLATADRRRLRRPLAARALRIGAAVVTVALAIVLLAVGGTTGDGRLVAGGIVAIVVGIAAAVVALVSDARRSTAFDRVADAQRAEVVALLERARIPQRGAVPGLRDRISRALTILREQQK